MASVIEELKKNWHYSTRTLEENQEAHDLSEDGLVKVSNGGSITVDGEKIVIINCEATAKFKKLVKDKKI
ncbi:hypothetical protein [Franconibacter pulveris]|uniref:Uncharacterized protein n=1 Tax=Franconibacter pulveris TaxID=435910 RepID=A0A0J8VN26_9ENTR|nr:hypothetical protein [Franconibacter pulveris]KMV33925.1 hypothetical protein ACH50_14560 [Franconibacter pulveris]